MPKKKRRPKEIEVRPIAIPPELPPDADIISLKPIPPAFRKYVEDARSGADIDAVKVLQETMGTSEQRVRVRMRDNAMIALVQAGHDRFSIAKLLGIKENSVRVALWRARARGELNDLRAILEHESSALAVNAINHHLRKKNPEVAIEHLKGMGFYKNHSHVRNDGVPPQGLPPLQVNIVLTNAPGSPNPTAETFDVSPLAIGVAREDA